MAGCAQTVRSIRPGDQESPAADARKTAATVVVSASTRRRRPFRSNCSGASKRMSRRRSEGSRATRDPGADACPAERTNPVAPARRADDSVPGPDLFAFRDRRERADRPVTACQLTGPERTRVSIHYGLSPACGWLWFVNQRPCGVTSEPGRPERKRSASDGVHHSRAHGWVKRCCGYVWRDWLIGRIPNKDRFATCCGLCPARQRR